MRWLTHLAPWLDALYASLSLAVVGIVSSPGSLSAQVLRLLTRDNDWSGFQTFDNGTLLLTPASGAPAVPTNSLYSIGGNLYFNGVLVATSAGAGTVTSVALTMPAIFAVSGSPVVTAGTLAVTAASQAANLFWAGPPTGIPTTPSFRAIDVADVPQTITINGSGNVTWASVSKSGSSLADLATRSATDLTTGSLALARLTDGTTGIPLVGNGGSGPQYAAVSLAGAGVTGTLAAARMPAMTGDATSSAGAVALTLANTGVAAATYGSSTTVPVLTVDAKGRITAASNASLTGSFAPSLISGAVRGSVMIGNNTPVFAVVVPTVTGSMLRFDGTDSGWSTNGSALTGLNASALASGTTPILRGGTGVATTPTDGQLLVGRTSDGSYQQTVPTGTANQVTVTTGPGTLTFSLPQSIATSSTPQFARIGAGTGADTVAALYAFGPIKRREILNGSSGAAFAIDLSQGDVQTLTLSANCTITLNNPVAGAIYRLLLVQDGSGNRTVTWPTIKWAGGSAPTLTVTAGKTDIITLFYDGTSYYGDKQLNY
jgi:hypothetical protein